MRRLIPDDTNERLVLSTYNSKSKSKIYTIKASFSRKYFNIFIVFIICNHISADLIIDLI